MSRIGFMQIDIPNNVEININEDNLVEVKGPKGELTQEINSEMIIEIEDNILKLDRPSNNKTHRSMHGLSRTLINNMIIGVTEGYEKTLEIQGTGYRAAKDGNKLVLTLGYSHPLELEDPENIEVEVPAQNKIIIRGIDKQQVGNYAANIRDYRKPEPYKGKGIRYSGEYVRRKVGKTGK